MKRKTLTLTLSLLVCFALIGVGYASWVITGATEASKQGNFVVDTVADKRLKVEMEWIGNSAQIVYGQKGTGPDWLTVDDNGKAEALTAQLKATVTKKDGSAFNDANDLNITTVISGNDTFTTAATNGYVDALPTDTEKSFEISDDKKTITITFTIEFGWGSKFNKKNPMQYFKEEDAKLRNASGYLLEGKEEELEELKDTALSYLQEIEKLSGTQFGFKLVINLNN